MATTKPTSTTNIPKKWYLIAPIILALATVITYYPSLTYDFQFDDIYNIKKFFDLRFIENFSSWFFKGSRWISYMLNVVHYHLGKFEPFVYRRSNLIFHASNGVLVFFVTLVSLSSLKKKDFFSLNRLPIAFFTGLLFLLHPVQTQTVSYVIQGQLEGLALLFVMAIILTYLCYNKTTSLLLQIPLLFLIFGFGILSCGTKEIAILSPILLILIDWFFVSQADFSVIKKNIPFFITYTAVIAYHYSKVLNFPFLKNSLSGAAELPNNVGNVITTNPNQVIKPFTYFISQFKVIIHYITIFMWPFNMSVDYDWVMLESFWQSECILPLLLILSLLTATLFLLYKNKTSLVAFGSLWFFIGLAPRSTIIPSTELLVDYKTYFSSFGILFLGAAGLVYAFEKLTKKIAVQKTVTAYSCTVLCMVLLGYATYDRNKVWKSSEAFWFNIIQNAPKKARAYNNYAVAIAEQQRYDEAIPYLRKAIKLDRHYPDPWSNIAVCYSCISKIDVAIDCLKQAITINPNYPEFYNNLSSFLLQKGEFGEVKRLAQQAIRLRPHYGKAFFNWGQALYNEGNKLEAFQKIKHSCIYADYDVAESFKVYADLAVELEKYEDALIGYSRLSAAQPNNADAFFNVGNAHYHLKQYDQAKKVYLSLVQQNPAEYRSWFNLGELYDRENNFSEAASCYEKALPVAPNFPEINQRLAACKQKLERRVG